MSDRSKIEAELNLLVALEQGEVVTQMTLSRRIAVSVGLINALVKRAIRKGYVKASAAPYKRYAYYLTPMGMSEKGRLVGEYLHLSLEFFRRARREYVEVFDRARAVGMRRIALVGVSELTEIAAIALPDGDLRIEAVLDPEAGKDRQFGLPVVARIEDLPEVDAFVLTDSRAPQQVFDWLVEHVPEERIFAPPVLCVSPTRLGLASEEAVL